MVLHFEKSKSERLWLHQPGIAEQQKGGKEKEKEMQSPGVSCTHTDGRLGGTDLDKVGSCRRKLACIKRAPTPFKGNATSNF